MFNNTYNTISPKFSHSLPGVLKFTLINAAKNYGKPTYFIIDRLPSYNEAAATVFLNTEHVSVAPMSSYINNNLIESFNKTFKA